MFLFHLSVRRQSEDVTWVRTVVDSPGNDWRRGSLSVAGQGQSLAFVQGYVTWQLFESWPHVDGQVDVLSHRARCIGSYTCKHSSIPRLCEEINRWCCYMPQLYRSKMVKARVKSVGHANLSPLNYELS